MLMIAIAVAVAVLIYVFAIGMLGPLGSSNSTAVASPLPNACAKYQAYANAVRFDRLTVLTTFSETSSYDTFMHNASNSTINYAPIYTFYHGFNVETGHDILYTAAGTITIFHC